MKSQAAQGEFASWGHRPLSECDIEVWRRAYDLVPRDRQIIALKKFGIPDKVIARRYGLSPDRVSKIGRV